MRQLYAYLLIGTISFGIQTALAEELFTAKVVSSNAPQYQLNQILKATDNILLEDGQEIVLKNSYDKRRIDGPFSGTLKALKNLFQVSCGKPLMNPWQVYVLKGENFCYFPSKPVTLGRSKENAQQKMTLYLQEEGSDKRPYRLTWLAKETTLEWPQALPITDGKQYKVRIKNRDSIVYLNFYQLPDEKLVPSNASKAVEMIKRGCQRQADLLTYID